MLFPDDRRVEGGDTPGDRLRWLFIDELAGDPDIPPVVEDLALTGFDVTGLVGSRRLFPVLLSPRLLMTIPLSPE